MSPRTKQTLRWALTAVVVTVVVVYFARTLSMNWEQFQRLEVGISPWLGGVVIVDAIAVILSGILWGRMTSDLARRQVPIREAVRVHCLSWILKYVPGQVGAAVNKVAWAASQGLSKTLVLITFVYENVFMLLGSLVPPSIILLVLGTSIASVEGSVTIALLALMPLALVIYRPLFRWMVNLVAARTIKTEVPLHYFLAGKQALLYQVLYLVPRLVNGLGFAWLAHLMFGVDRTDWLPLGAVYVVAGAVGLLAFMVPSGLGVREAVIVGLASTFIPVDQAVVLSLAARLFATVADGLVAAVYGVLSIGSQRKVANT